MTTSLQHLAIDGGTLGVLSKGNISPFCTAIVPSTPAAHPERSLYTQGWGISVAENIRVVLVQSTRLNVVRGRILCSLVRPKRFQNVFILRSSKCISRQAERLICSLHYRPTVYARISVCAWLSDSHCLITDSLMSPFLIGSPSFAHCLCRLMQVRLETK